MFYLILDGRVALQLTVPGRGADRADDASPARSSALLARADEPQRLRRQGAGAGPRDRGRRAPASRQVRGRSGLGYDPAQGFMPPLVRRLQDTRLRLIDVYGSHA